MTITEIADYGGGFPSAHCTWFDKQNAAGKVFPLHALKKEEV